MKEFVHRLRIEPDKTNRLIIAVTGENSTFVGMLKDLPVYLDQKVVKLNFLFVDGSPYEVIVGDPIMEILQGVLDLGYREESFSIDGQRVEITMELDCDHEDPGCKLETDSEDFTSATSGCSSDSSTSGSEAEVEMTLTIDGRWSDPIGGFEYGNQDGGDSEDESPSTKFHMKLRNYAYTD